MCAGGFCFALWGLFVTQAGGNRVRSRLEAGGAMAENEQAEGATEGAEAAPSKKGKLKLIIAVGRLRRHPRRRRGGWFFFMRGHGEEKHAEAPPPKPPSFVEVPDMMVNLVGAPGERVQYLKVKVVLEVKEEKQVETIKPTCRASPTCSRPTCANCGPAISTVRPGCFASRKN